MANVAKKKKKLKLVHSEKAVLFNHMRMVSRPSRTSLFKREKKKNSYMSRNPKRFAEASSQLQVMPKKKGKKKRSRIEEEEEEEEDGRLKINNQMRAGRNYSVKVCTISSSSIILSSSSIRGTGG